MRKRIGIGLLAVVFVGAVAFFVTQPKKGSVEWHVSEYRAVQRQISTGRTLKERAIHVADRLLGKRGHVRVSINQLRRMEEHRRALIDLGYLEQHELVLSHRSTDEVIDGASRLFRAHPKRTYFQEAFLHVDTRGTNVLIVVAKPNDMPVVKEIVRKADVP